MNKEQELNDLLETLDKKITIIYDKNDGSIELIEGATFGIIELNRNNLTIRVYKEVK